MTTFKPCPRCGFQASLNARSCARCGNYFPDVAPHHVRAWILRYARTVRDQHPDLGPEDLRTFLEEHLLHDPSLQKAVLEDGDFRATAVSQGLLDEVMDFVKGMWAKVSGEHPDTVRKLKVAIQGAIEEVLEARSGPSPFPPA